MKNSSWYPTYGNHRERNSQNSKKPCAGPGEARRRMGALTVTMAVSARKCESSTVPIAPAPLFLLPTPSPQLVLTELLI